MYLCCEKPIVTSAITASLNAPKSKIYLLLSVVLVFYLATFFIQVRLITSQDRSETEDLKISIEESRRIKHALGLSGQKLVNMVRVDFETCAKLVDANIELNDLISMKQSYLSELKKIEQKRRQLLRTLGKLNNQLNTSRHELAQLENKNSFLRAKLHTDAVQLNEIRHLIAHGFEQVNAINTAIEHAPELNKAAVAVKRVSIDSAVDISKCKYNRKLGIHWFTPTKSNEYLNDLRTVLDLDELGKSVKFEKTAKNACLVLVVLIKPSGSKAYYRELVRFIVDNKKSTNILFLVPSMIESFSRRVELEKHLSSFDTQNSNAIKRVVGRSLFASFEALDELSIRFSVAFEANYWSEKKSIDRTSLVSIGEHRDFLLTYHQNSASQNSHLDSQLETIKQVFNSSEHIIIDLDCESKSFPNSSLCFGLKTRYELFSASQFTLIIESSADFTTRLSESLSRGTIPVLIGLELKLPLDDLIAWDEIVVRLPAERISYLVPILESIDRDDLARRQIKARKVYTAYFASPTQQLRTVMAAVSTRLGLPPVGVDSQPTREFSIKKTRGSSKLSEDEEDKYDGEDEDGEMEFVGESNQTPVDSPQFAHNYTQSSYVAWNQLFYPFNLFPSTPFEANSIPTRPQPIQQTTAANNFYLNEYLKERNFTYGGGDGKYFHHHLSGNHPEEQYTMVVLTYKREKILSEQLSKYLRYPYLHSIVVVWNSAGGSLTTPSREFTRRFASYLASRRLVLVKSDANSLNNRFLPYDTIKTDAVLSLDDDTSLRPDEVMLAFRVWRENRARIVGFPSRYHTLDMNTRDYDYRSQLSCEYSMVLTGAAFYHRFYHYAYSQIMDERIRKKVDELMNCEDIAFNMLVAHMVRQAPLKVTTRVSFYCAECAEQSANSTASSSISMQRGHYEKRSQCLRHFVSLYGYNPLLYSQYRADSVLYKTKLPPDMQKCFKLV